MNRLPFTFRAGDTLQWTESHPEYPASNGWQIKYVLHNKNAHPITLESTADGDKHAFSKSAADTAGYDAGQYTYVRLAVKDSGADQQRYTLSTGSVEIQINLGEAGTADTRSFNQKMVDLLENVLLELVENGKAEVQINGRRWRKDHLDNYVKQYNEFKKRLDKEKREQQGKKRGPILVKFDKVG